MKHETVYSWDNFKNLINENSKKKILEKADTLETSDGYQSSFWIVVSEEEIIIDNGYDIQTISNTEIEYLDSIKETMEDLERYERDEI